MRRENSGLIDLDALLKEASQPELPKSADSSLEVSAPPPEPPPPAPVAEPPPSPPHPVSSVRPVAEPPKAEPPKVEKPRPVPPPKPAEDSLRAITSAAPAKTSPSRKKWLALAVLPLGVVMVIAMRRSPDAPAPMRTASAATVDAPSSPTPTPMEAVPNAPPGISLADLPAPTASSSAAPAASHAVHAPAPTPVAIASAKLGEIADAPQSLNGDLGGAMRDAVGAKASADITKVDAPSGEGARQLRPSPGAVVGAINSVMPAARMCLDGSEIVRNATIVFKSDGTVARVDIAGSPNVADDCIRGALTNARMTPFLAETFAARATVRP